MGFYVYFELFSLAIFFENNPRANSMKLLPHVQRNPGGLELCWLCMALEVAPMRNTQRQPLEDVEAAFGRDVQS